MLRRGNPFVWAAVAVAAVLVALAVDGTGPRVLLAALAVAAAVVCVLLLRNGRDPNGPPGQH